MKRNGLEVLLKTVVRKLFNRGTFLSWGQNGEDVLIHALLRNVKRGTYIDVGAYNPLLYSNTYAFYRAGWKGVVIDPNPAMKLSYRVIRPRDTFVQAGVGTQGIQTYFAFSDGAYNTFDEKEAEHRRGISHIRFLGSSNVPMRPLQDILKENNLKHIDFINIDVEGLELEVLKTHDWNIRPKLIAVESHEFNPDQPMDTPVYKYLRDHQYSLKGLASFTLLFVDDQIRKAPSA